jgi:O-antigen/teichoic acid export membrane protein
MQPLHYLKNKTISLLHWSEQYTKTDMVYLVKGGGWLTAGKVFSILGGLGLATAFANLIPQETYGTYKFVVSAASIIGGFTLAGMGTAVTQAVARGYEGALKYGLKKKLRWSIGIVVVGLGAAGYYYLNENMTLAAGMLMIAASYPLRTSFGLFENYLVGKKNFKHKSIYSSVLEAVQIIVMVATLFVTDNVLWVLFAFFATNTLGAIFFYFYTVWTHQPGNKTDKSMLTYSKHLSAITLFKKLARHIDKILVWHFLGPVQLAIYSFATLPVSKIGTMLSSIQQIALPKFSQKSPTKLQRTLDYKVVLLGAGFAVIAISYVLLAPFIFQIFFPKYLSSVTFTQVLSVNIFFSAGLIYHKVLEAQAETRWIYISKIGSNIIKIAVLLTLLPILGVWGAVYSMIAHQFTLAMLSYIGFKTS